MLDAALEAWHFTSSFAFDFGARKRGYGWWPRSQAEVREWYRPFIEIAVEVGRSQTDLGREVRTVLGESVRGLWVRARLADDVSAAAEELVTIGGWPEGWLGIRRILQWDKQEISEGYLQQLLKLEATLAPKDMKAKINAKVLARGTFSDDFEDNDDVNESPVTRLRKNELAIEDLGKAAALDERLLFDVLKDLLQYNTNGKVSQFGFGVGKAIQNPTGLLAEARDVIGTAQQSSVSLLFIRGFIAGWHQRRPDQVSAFLDQALFDEVWGHYFPELQLRVDLDSVGYGRLLKSLEVGMAPIWQYTNLGSGRVTDPLTVEQISSLIDAIASKPNGQAVAIDVLAMVIHCAQEKDDDYRRDLVRVCRKFLRRLDWSKVEDNEVDHDIEGILKNALSVAADDTDIPQILDNLLTNERSKRRRFSYGRGRLLVPFFEYFPKVTLDAVYVLMMTESIRLRRGLYAT